MGRSFAVHDNPMQKWFYRRISRFLVDICCGKYRHRRFHCNDSLQYNSGSDEELDGRMQNEDTFIENCAANESTSCDIQLRARSTVDEWDVMAHWLRRLLSTGGSWVRLPLWPSRRDLGQVLYLQ